ncbi:MAG: molybdopterin cofactor-binding domain-containing protein [Bacilli bacterium]|nr:molybdopterin cofactor-binding domain-containing protein [Bacilli bacterium]MDY6362928.1 molybdopterin cofactor-binding domain-containing protein [Bacilli bacterium]
MKKNFRVVNNITPSLDGKGLMQGRSFYTDDLAAQNSLVIKLLRSPHAFARIKSIDVSEAEKVPGVACILTKDNVPHVPFTRAGQGYPEPSPHDKFIFDDYARYVGDEVAAVAAVSEEIASEAMKKIKVDYEVLEPVLDFEKAYENKSVIHPEDGIHEMFPIGFDPKKNLAASYEMEVGNVAEELKKCDYIVEDTFYSQAQAHAMLEPHTCNARLDEHNRLVIYSATQTPFHMRRIMSKTLGLPVEKIRVIKPRVGGGFGGKQAFHGEMFCALVTLRTKKPSKCVFTREEVFGCSYTRHPMKITLKVGATKDGIIQAIDCRALSDTGAYGEHALTVFMIVGSKVLPLYNKVKAVRFGGRVVYTNHVSAGAYRGYGAIQGNYAVESIIDELAEKMGMDPIKLRELNSMKEKETSPIFEIMGEGTEGTAMIMESCKLPYCIKRGRELIEWDKKWPRKEVGPHKVRSVGCAIAMQGSGIPFLDMGSCTIKLNDGGSYMVTVGATDIGQGSDTLIAQIVAEELQTTVDKIIIYSSDTDLTPYDCGAYASSTTYVSGNAAWNAASKMRERLVKEAAEYMNVKVGTVEFDGKMFTSGEKSLSLEDLATNRLYNQDTRQIAVTESFHGHVSPPPFMAAFGEFEFDTETYEYKMIKYVTVTDCGTTINPMLAKGQVEGGIIQGYGMASSEEVIYNDKGKLLTTNFDVYHIPTRADVGELVTEFADSYEPTGPFGAKSVGEIGIDTPPAVLCNAVYNAFGVRIHHLPITPERIFKAVQEKK